MESLDPNDYKDYVPVRTPKLPKGKIVLLLVLLGFTLALLLFAIHPQKAQQVVEATSNAVQAVSTPQPKPAETDPELRQQNAEYKKQVSDLQDKIKTQEATIRIKDQQIATKEKQAQSTEKVLSDITTERNKYRDLYNNSPLYWDRMNKAHGWHLHFGALVTNPVDFSGFKVDPTVTLLAGIGPERWQVLTGVGFDPEDGMTVSIGFIWTCGDIGL